MSLLQRFIRNAFRGPAAWAPASPKDILGLSKDVAASKAAGKPSKLEGELLDACAAGHADQALRTFESQFPAAVDRAEAVDRLKRLALPIIEACVRNRDSATACALEHVVYDTLIKKFEDPDHYERCFSLLDDRLHELGSIDSAPVRTDPVEAPRRLLFFLHNMSNDFAHLTLLCDLIDAFLRVYPYEASSVGLVGVCLRQPSSRVLQLQQKWGVGVWPISHQIPMQQAYLAAANVLSREGYDRMVFTAAPLGLSYASGLIGPRLSWMSMKFELSCFRHLLHRCSFVSGVRRTRVLNGIAWHEAPPLFTEPVVLESSLSAVPALEAARRFGTVFYTVNREEKIRNPEFLAAVATILKEVPNSAFVWTGRQQLPDITKFFTNQRLSDRHFFAGWVRPDDLVLGADIFLDTPVLSGTVAARAAAGGRPVVSLADSHSWINFFWPAYVMDRGSEESAELDARVSSLRSKGLEIQCEEVDQYVAQAVRLAADPELRTAYGDLLASFAHRYFFNAQRSAADHFVNLRQPISFERQLQPG